MPFGQGGLLMKKITGKHQIDKYWGFSIIIIFLLLASMGLLACAPPKTPEFPSKAINIITGWTGGSTKFSEVIANEAGRIFGVPVEVIDKEGNGGIDSIEAFQVASQDGYTLICTNDLYASSFAQGRIGVNPSKDWVTILIANLSISQIYILTDDQRYSNWDELLAYAKEHSGLKVATVGSSLDLEGLSISSLERSFGIKLQQVSYGKAPERYASLLGGQTDLLIEQPGDVKKFLDTRKFKPILSLWDEPVRGFEDVPTAGEKGADLVPLLRIRGLALPKGTPQDRIEKLKTVFHAAFESQTFQQYLKDYTLDLLPYPDDPVAFMKEQVNAYKDLYESHR